MTYEDLEDAWAFAAGGGLSREGLESLRDATERAAYVRAIRFVARSGRGLIDDPWDLDALADEVAAGDAEVA